MRGCLGPGADSECFLAGVDNIMDRQLHLSAQSGTSNPVKICHAENFLLISWRLEIVQK
jgi:hypothetical protein